MKKQIYTVWFIVFGLLATVVILTAISDNISPAPTTITAKTPAPIATATPYLIRGKTGTWLTSDGVHAASIGQVAAKIAADNHLTLACDSEIAAQVPVSDQQPTVSDLDYLGREVRNVQGSVTSQNGVLSIVRVAIGAEETTAPRQFEKWVAHLQGIYQDCAGPEKHARRTALTSRDLREVVTECNDSTNRLRVEWDAIPSLLDAETNGMPSDVKMIAMSFWDAAMSYAQAYSNFLEIKDGRGAGRAADAAIEGLREGDESAREAVNSIRDVRKRLGRGKERAQPAAPGGGE